MVNFSVFNELSLPLRDIKEFEPFFSLLRDLRILGLEKIRMDRKFTSYPEILPNITFQQLVGQLTDRNKKRRLLSFLNNSISVIESPLIFEDEEEREQLLENEYFYNNKTTIGGLACCDIWNTIAVSFLSHERWSSYNIHLQKESILANKREIYIRHISKSEHIKAHKDFFDEIENELKLEINQSDFWDRRDEFFPNKIIFSKEVEKQIQNLDLYIFQQAMGILRDVEKNRKLITDFSHSGESKSVKQDETLKKQRYFTVEDKKVFFENHIKSLPNANRIYFLEQGDKIFIGYIGKHLPTKKH